MDLVGLVKHQLRLVDDEPAYFGGNHRFFGAIENHNAQLIFQLFYLHAQSGLRYKTCLGSSGKIAVAVDGHQIL
jgi:hypothetical protein